MSKREAMRKRARRELAKREGGDSPSKSPKTPEKIEKDEKAPSFISGFVIILFGSIVFSIFFTQGDFLLGILASAAFIIIGMRRIFKATAVRNKPETLAS